MKLTKNEEKTLELILSKPNIKNQEIADNLSLTSQAIGKIRSNLRKKGILKYIDRKHNCDIILGHDAIHESILTAEKLKQLINEYEDIKKAAVSFQSDKRNINRRKLLIDIIIDKVLESKTKAYDFFSNKSVSTS